MDGISILEALGLSVIGMAVVFVVLIFLMFIINLLSVVFYKRKAAPGNPVDTEADSSEAR